MADLQVPPAVGTSGQRLDTIVINAGSTIFRQTVVIGDPVSSGNLGKVDSAGNQLMVSASSGIVQVQTSGTYIIVSASSGLVQTLTSGPILTASSGQLGTYPSTGKHYSVFTFNASSSNSLVCVTTAAATLHGWNVGNTATSAALAIRTYNSTTATAGSTSNLQGIIPIPGGSAGAGNNLILPQGVSYASGLTFIIAQNFNATSTDTNHSAGDVSGTLYYV